jgi:Kef-type K+ transport system membrane component KefB
MPMFFVAVGLSYRLGMLRYTKTLGRIAAVKKALARIRNMVTWLTV